MSNFFRDHVDDHVPKNLFTGEEIEKDEYANPKE